MKYIKLITAAVVILIHGQVSALELLSEDVANGTPLNMGQIANIFGCAGGNLSPALTWKGAPPKTRSYALTVYDPDAPTGSGWWHWVVYDIAANISDLPSGTGVKQALPLGAQQGKNDLGQQGYMGACPPAGGGVHRYQFVLRALNVDKLDVPKDASPALVGYMLNQATLESAMIEATYSR